MTPAQGASITSTTTRPYPLSDHPTPRAPNQLVVRLNIEHQSPWGASHAHQMEALQTDQQITPTTTIKRHRAASRARHRPRSLTTAGVEVRSSPRTSTSTRNPRPTPDHPHSTRKSQQSLHIVERPVTVRFSLRHGNCYVLGLLRGRLRATEVVALPASTLGLNPSCRRAIQSFSGPPKPHVTQISPLSRSMRISRIVSLTSDS